VGLYGDRILPWLIDVSLRSPEIGAMRDTLLRDLSGNVLEVGFGTGLSVRHYPRSVTRLYALDPGTPRFRRVATRISAAPFPVILLPFDPAGPYPLADHAVDAVTSMFTLCTIPDPEAALREMLRVLKPGGSLAFLEHGRAEAPHLGRWQTRLSPVWSCFTGGCQLDRDIPGIVERSGFHNVRHERIAAEGVPPLMGRLYRGVAVKRA
jgi:ubiquinone/menaquinone biosynthesis C-methylase UbiE